jgi:hypothetical protein
MAIFFSYSIYKLLILLSKSDTKTITNSFIEELNYTNPDIVQINELGFDVAFNFWPPLTPDIGYMVVTHDLIHWEKNNVTGSME